MFDHSFIMYQIEAFCGVIGEKDASKSGIKNYTINTVKKKANTQIDKVKEIFQGDHIALTTPPTCARPPVYTVITRLCLLSIQ